MSLIKAWAMQCSHLPPAAGSGTDVLMTLSPTTKLGFIALARASFSCSVCVAPVAPSPPVSPTQSRRVSRPTRTRREAHIILRETSHKQCTAQETSTWGRPFQAHLLLPMVRQLAACPLDLPTCLLRLSVYIKSFRTALKTRSACASV